MSVSQKPMKPQKPVSDMELAVLRLLWATDDSLSSRTIMEELYPTCTPSDYATVHSLLKRLEAKQLVARDRRRQPHLFTAEVSQSEFAGSQLEMMAEKVSGGSMAPFLSHLLQSQSLSRSQLDELQEMIENAKPKKQKSKRNSKPKR